MNQKIKVGSVYLSPAPAAQAYLVKEMGIKTVTVINIRSNREYIIRLTALANEYELIGIPYNQEPVNDCHS